MLLLGAKREKIRTQPRGPKFYSCLDKLFIPQIYGIPNTTGKVVSKAIKYNECTARHSYESGIMHKKLMLTPQKLNWRYVHTIAFR